MRSVAIPTMFLLVAAGPTLAGDALLDIASARPCSSIATDRFGATGNCAALASPNGLAVRLEAKAGSASFALPASVLLPGGKTVQDATVSIDGLMLYNGSIVPEAWRLNAGDTLRVALSNRLTPGEDAATNLHTHGLLVSPDLDTKSDGRAAEPVGDTVYVCTIPAGEVIGSPSSKNCGMHGSVYGASASEMNYQIALPRSHPDGLFWYHPHVHMNARAQVGSGLSGLIYVKAIDPSLSGGTRPAPGTKVVERLMMLKDIQFGSVDLSDEKNIKATFLPVKSHDSGLCPQQASGALPWEGACFGKDGSGADAGWLFTLNGQVFPHIDVEPDAIEIWRIANTSADMTYDLALVEEGTGRPLRVRILARDGTSATTEGAPDVILTERVLLMPGSRIEIGVNRATAEGYPAGVGDLKARLRSYGFHTGGAANFGDSWPAVDIAEVIFKASDAASTVSGSLLRADRERRLASGQRVKPSAESLIVTPWKQEIAAPKTAGPSRSGAADTRPAMRTTSMHAGHAAGAEGSSRGGRNEDCRPMSAGEQRVIALAIEKIPNEDPDKTIELFKIGATRAVIRNASDMDRAAQSAISSAKSFGQGSVVLCGHAGRIETWTIVNPPKKLLDKSFDPNGNNETHNFHIHQMKFLVEDVVDPTGRITAPLGGPKAKRKVDSFPVPIGGSIRIRVAYTKDQVGRFVFHCHILEHEDKGMMAEIEVKER